VQKEEFSNNMLYVRNVHLTEGQAYLWHKPIFLSERMLHKDYYHKGSIGGGGKSGRGSQGAWRQDKLIGGKPPVVN
jgi:hypothetical protein